MESQNKNNAQKIIESAMEKMNQVSTNQTVGSAIKNDLGRFDEAKKAWDRVKQKGSPEAYAKASVNEPNKELLSRGKAPVLWNGNAQSNLEV